MNTKHQDSVSPPERGMHGLDQSDVTILELGSVKGLQLTREGIKLSLYADIILHVENPKESTKKIL